MLLAKIARAADPNSSHRTTFRDNDVEQSITKNIVQMLNTRAGACLTCPDFGIIEVSELLHDFPDAIGLVQRSIKNAIQQYEPRLKNVQVRHIKSDELSSMNLFFELTGQFTFPDGRKGQLRLSTSVDGSGNVKAE